jgi:hypothetical protein
MLLIAHRGNIHGPNPDKENQPEYLLAAQSAGFLVEVDIWYGPAGWFLGHDDPLYSVDETIFEKLSPENTIWHAKNPEALEMLLAHEIPLHVLCHEEDDYAFTSYGLPWVYPGKQLFPGAVAVMPEKANYESLHFCGGICSDYIQKYADRFPY